MIAFLPWSHRRPPAPPADDDDALARAVAAGDTTALETVYRRHAAPVYRYALALGGNADWAADATQQAFIALADRPEAFDAARGSLAAYLAGVARHHLLAAWRDRPWPAPELDDEALEEPGGPGPEAATPEALLVQRQGIETLWRALATLPWPQREALVLVDLQQRDYADAARIAGVALNTLRSRLHRGRGRLAALLGAARCEPGDPE